MKLAQRRAFAIGLAILLNSCAAHGPQPWRGEDGTTRGTVVTDMHEDGSSTKGYFDLTQHLLRLERLDAQGRPIAGAWLSTFSYENGRRVAREEWAVDGSRAMNESGYAIARFDPDDQSCRFFSTTDQPVNRSDGAHRVVQSFVNGRLEEVSFYDVTAAPVSAPGTARRVYTYRGSNIAEIRHVGASGTPAAGVYKGIEVSIVRYEVIRGVDDRVVIAEHYLDTSGRAIRTKFYSEFPPVPDECA